MKKTLIITILIFLITISSAIFVIAKVNSYNEKIILTETVFYGEKTHFEDIIVTSISSYQNRLFWETKNEISNKNSVSTIFSYFSEKIPELSNYEKKPFDMFVNLTYGFNTSIPYEDLSPLQKIYTDMYNECHENERIEKTINISDIYEYYPLNYIVNIDGVYWSGNDYENLMSDEKNSEKNIHDVFGEYFKIPVLKNYMIDISVSRSKNSISVGSGISEGCIEYNYNTDTVSTCTKDTVYFSFANKTSYNIPVDTSLIPGGYGIYAFNYSKESGSDTNTGIDSDSLRNVYTLNPDESVIALSVSNDEKNLLVLSTTQNQSIFSVIDIETMKTLKTVTINNFKAYTMKYCNNGTQSNNNCFTVIFSADKIALIDENFNLYFTALRPEYFDENYEILSSEAALAFDGRRLIAVDSLSDEISNFPNCGYYVAVYDSSGLVFYAEYNSNLDTNRDSPYKYYCHPYNAAYKITLN